MKTFDPEIRETQGPLDNSLRGTGKPNLRAKLLAALPREVPFALRWSERSYQALAGATGVALGLGVSAAIALRADPESTMGHIFDRHNLETLIPVSICCMFCWGALLAGWRLLRLHAVVGISGRSLLLRIVQVLSAPGPNGLRKHLEGPAAAASPLLRRVRGVLEQWSIAPGMAQADIVLQQHAATDEEEVAAGYTLVRAFVWALPVVGLIGTVIGISRAVGRFALFLGSGADDVALIKQNLVGVTGGLSFAFLITLQGLLTSLLLMLAASALQSRERRLLAVLQQDIADRFLPALQRAAPEERPAAAVASAAGDPLAESIGGLKQEFGHFVQTLAAQRQDLRDLTQAFEQVGQLTDQVTASQADLHRAIKELHDTGLERTFATFRDSIASVAAVLEAFRKPFMLQAVALPSNGDKRGLLAQPSVS